MKRFVILVIIVMIFVLSVAGFAAKKTRVSADQLAIKKSVLAWDNARLKFKKPVLLRAVKFDPVVISSGWARTTYYELDKKGRVIPSDPAQYLVKKSKSKWQTVMMFFELSIDKKKAAEIGLSNSTAKKLGISLVSFN